MSFAHSNGILAGSVAACLGLLVGCSSNNNTSPGNTGDGGATAATFTEVYTTIIGTTCTDHHSGANPSGALDMSTQAKAYADLVGVKAAGPSCGTSGETRVVAGSHATSLLYMKVAGTQTCGNQMPDGLTPISSDKVALIQSWIDDGALNN